MPINNMVPYKSAYYSMEFIEEDEKIIVLFYNDQGELIAKRDLPKYTTVANHIERNRQN
ncbi:MAG: hypothetical protein NT178_17165 [Proteobacteria bacterium]|nr:hypothetical protein [Pseudomonadota bacterium]